MGSPLIPITIPAPGIRGLNTQSSAVALGPEWAKEATNCVIDETGRIAAREGWTKQHASAISGTPTIKQVFQYKPITGSNVIIIAAGNKIYKDETSPTDITGSVTITGDNWKFQNINGNMVGFQDGHEPIWWDGTGNIEYLVDQNTQWAAATAYSLGDVVVPTSRNGYFYECTAAGTSAGGEPTWDTDPDTPGTTTDNTVTWTTREIPKGNEVLAAWGRIWAASEDKTFLWYSDILIPQNNSGSGGTINLKAVWVHGHDHIQSITSFNNNLVIFGRDNVVAYGNADDISNIALTDLIKGLGCIARDSVQHIDEDVFFLHHSGVRSLKRTILRDKAPMTDISINVKDDIVLNISLETMENVRSVYDNDNGRYLLTFPASSVLYCIDVRKYVSQGEVVITLWDSINPTAITYADVHGVFIGTSSGFVGKLGGQNDNGDSYTLNFKTGWTNLGAYYNSTELLGKEIFIKQYIATCITSQNANVTLSWVYDFSGALSSQTKLVASGGPAEYNISEYNIAEWSGGDTSVRVAVEGTNSGKIFSLGISVPISGNTFSYQFIDILFKLGRLG